MGVRLHGRGCGRGCGWLQHVVGCYRGCATALCHRPVCISWSATDRQLAARLHERRLPLPRGGCLQLFVSRVSIYKGPLLSKFRLLRSQHDPSNQTSTHPNHINSPRLHPATLLVEPNC